MKIGDQLELVAKLKGKGQEKRQKKSKPCWRIWASKLVTTNTRIRCPVGKNNGQPSWAFIGNPQVILADEPTFSLEPDKERNRPVDPERSQIQKQERHEAMTAPS